MALISIHALREEGDTATRSRPATTRYFYPRPPRGGRLLHVLDALPVSDFYPRPPRGGRLGNYLHALEVRAISIHALREEGDGYSWNREYGWIQFLSTPSARRATGELSPCTRSPCNFYPRPPRGGRRLQLESGVRVDTISIHALREEGDQGLCCST